MTGRQRKGFPVNHYNEMSHLPKGQCSSKELLLKSSILAWPHPSSFAFGPLALVLAFHLCSYLSNLSIEQAQSGINSHVTGNPQCFDTSGYDKKVYYTAVISITAEQLGFGEAQNGGRQAEEISSGGVGDRL